VPPRGSGAKRVARVMRFDWAVEATASEH